MVLRLKSCTVRFDRHLPYANELKASSVAEDGGIPRYIRQLRELRSCELVAMDMGRLWKSEATEDVPAAAHPSSIFLTSFRICPGGFVKEHG